MFRGGDPVAPRHLMYNCTLKNLMIKKIIKRFRDFKKYTNSNAKIVF